MWNCKNCAKIIFKENEDATLAYLLRTHTNVHDRNAGMCGEGRVEGCGGRDDGGLCGV